MTNWWVLLDYSDSSGPFLTMNFEFDHDYGPRPGPELDKFNMLEVECGSEKKQDENGLQSQSGCHGCLSWMTFMDDCLG